MRHHEEDPRESAQLRERLRAADPAAGLAPSEPGATERMVAEVLDAGRREIDPVRATGTRNRHPLTWVLAAAAVVMIAAAVGYTLLGPEDDDLSADGGSGRGVAPGQPATPTASTSPPPSDALVVAAVPQGRCAVPSAETLAGKELAFAGRATRVSDRLVTLTPERTFAGSPTATVTLEAAPGGATVLETIRFEPGRRYLVAASGGEVALCGLSGPATPRLQALYDEAFGR